MPSPLYGTRRNGLEKAPRGASKSGYPAGLVWALQVGLIVAGHIAAILAAHRIAVSTAPRHRAAIRAQAPLITLMIGYTVLGLRILGLSYRVAVSPRSPGEV